MASQEPKQSPQGRGKLMIYLSNENPSFFIQLKGNNAGKPLKEKIPNAIGVKTNPEILNAQFQYYVVEFLFTTWKFTPHITGSVIPFLTHRSILKVIAEHFTK